MPTGPTVFLADADVLIDYRESELAILALVAQHVGRVTVLPSVLDEVQDVTIRDCAELGIEIVEVETAASSAHSMLWYLCSRRPRTENGRWRPEPT